MAGKEIITRREFLEIAAGAALLAVGGIALHQLIDEVTPKEKAVDLISSNNILVDTLVNAGNEEFPNYVGNVLLFDSKGNVKRELDGNGSVWLADGEHFVYRKIQYGGNLKVSYYGSQGVVTDQDPIQNAVFILANTKDSNETVLPFVNKYQYDWKQIINYDNLSVEPYHGGTLFLYEDSTCCNEGIFGIRLEDQKLFTVIDANKEVFYPYSSPSLSPDGTKILFKYNQSVNGDYEIGFSVADFDTDKLPYADDSTFQTLKFENSNRSEEQALNLIGWSGDSKNILFTFSNSLDSCALYIQNIETRETRLIKAATNISPNSLSQDHNKIVYLDGNSLVVFNITTGKTGKLDISSTDHGKPAWDQDKTNMPSWSANDGEIVFVRDKILYRIKSDGTGLQAFADSLNIQDFKLSPVLRK